MEIMEKAQYAHENELCVVCIYRDGFELVKAVGNVVNVFEDPNEFEVLDADNVSHVIREFEVVQLNY